MLGEGPTDDINDSIGAIKKKFGKYKLKQRQNSA